MTAETAAAVRPQIPTAAEPSTTPRVLSRLLITLLTTALVTALAALLVFTEAHRTVQMAGNSAGPAVVQVDAAYRALVDADREAARSALARTMPLDGPGQLYESDITAASQSLAQVGENNVAGAGASQELSLVEGLVVSYTALVEQADAAYRASAGVGSGNALGLSNLLNASQLMHEQDPGGILYDLNQLRSQEAGVLNGQRSAAWVNPAMSLLWMLPALALLTMMTWTGVYFYRRFRRIVNFPLVLAAVALLVLSAVSALALVSDAQFGSAQDGPFNTMATLSRGQADATDADGQASLAVLIAQSCPRVDGACVQTMEALVSGSAKTVGHDVTTMPRQVADGIKALTSKDNQAAILAQSSATQAEAALPPAAVTSAAPFTKISTAQTSDQDKYQDDVSTAGAAFGIRLAIIALMAVLMVVLIPFAIQPRVNEYRYRSR